MLFRRKFRKRSRRPNFLVIFVLLLFCAIFIDHQLRPNIIAVSQNVARTVATAAINAAITATTAQNSLDSSDFIDISRDSDNNITSLSANSMKINQITANITEQIQSCIAQDVYKNVDIPFGSLCGINFFTGRGPNINISLKLSNSITSNIVDTFTDAGINQTDLKIELMVTAYVYVMIPFYYSTQKVTDRYLIAQSIIVGKVPTQYTQVTGVDGSTLRDINDYGSTAAQSQNNTNTTQNIKPVAPTKK